MNHIFTWYYISLELNIKSRVFELLSRVSSRKIRVFALQVLPMFLSLNAQVEMEQNNVLLTPFNYFKWKVEMVIQLRSKCLYRVTMGTKKEPNYVVEKSKYFNRLDEAFGCFVSVFLLIFSSM